MLDEAVGEGSGVVEIGRLDGGGGAGLEFVADLREVTCDDWLDGALEVGWEVGVVVVRRMEFSC